MYLCVWDVAGTVTLSFCCERVVSENSQTTMNGGAHESGVGQQATPSTAQQAFGQPLENASNGGLTGNTNALQKYVSSYCDIAVAAHLVDRFPNAPDHDAPSVRKHERATPPTAGALGDNHAPQH